MKNNFRTREFLKESRQNAITQAYKSALLQEKNGWNTEITNNGGIIEVKSQLKVKRAIYIMLGLIMVHMIIILIIKIIT